MKAFPALLNRERWEHPAFWIVPGVFALLMLAAHVFGLVSMWRLGVDPADARYAIEQFTLLEGGERRAMLQSILIGMSVPFNMFLVGIIFFYAIASLYDDRRDRSILFWKSLPVSDVETVLSKLATATLLAPALTLLVMMVVHVFTLLFGVGIALWAGADGWITTLDPLALLAVWAKLAWGLFAQSLVLLPIIAWLMLASAWARKAPFLWAVVPPGAVMLLEAWATGRTVVGQWLVARFSEALPMVFTVTGGTPRGIRLGGGTQMFHADGVVTARFDLLWSTHLWSGIAIAAVFLAGAVWLRRYRAEAE